jgi:hypothetical protein
MNTADKYKLEIIFLTNPRASGKTKKTVITGVITG